MDARGLFIADNEFDSKLSELKKMFHSRMNGETTAQMRCGNLGYDTNYGVSLVHIKEIASGLTLSTDECRRLWQLSIREARIVALLAYPDDDTPTDTLLTWACGVSNSELVELSAQYLFARQTNANELIIRLLAQTDEYSEALAFYTAGRVLQRGKQLSDKAQQALDVAIGNIGEMSVCTQRALSFFGRQIARTAPEKAKKYIGQLSDKFQSIAYDIENELF